MYLRKLFLKVLSLCIDYYYDKHTTYSSKVYVTSFSLVSLCGAEIVISFYIDLVFVLENMYLSPLFVHKNYENLILSIFSLSLFVNQII
jgi:hypothetical protein